MRKLSAFIILIVCFFCITKCKEARANEAMLAALQEQVAGLSDIVKSLQSTVQHQNQLIEAQGAKIVYLEGSIEKGETPSKPTEPSHGINPEFGLAAVIQANSTQSKVDADGNDTIALKELELSIAQDINSESRLNAVIAFNDAIEEQNVEIEEGYYAHTGLPLGFRGQIGKFRSKIGKANLMYSHELDTADYPLVIRDFFGEEGMSSSGARLQKLIPNPWDIPLEMTGEILRGNNGTSFSGISRRPIFNTHTSTTFQTSETSNLELGITVMFGDQNPSVVTFDNDTLTETIPAEGQDEYGVKVFGADATFNFSLPKGQPVKWQNEIYFQNRKSTSGHPNSFPWGFYSLIDHRISKRFSLGVRFDYLEPLDFVDHDTVGISPYLTFWQSEFVDFKLQYSHTKPADGALEPNHEVFLKANIVAEHHDHA